MYHTNNGVTIVIFEYLQDKSTDVVPVVLQTRYAWKNIKIPL